ncbi:WD40 repeat domain-containing protein [Dictyobacter vulcani]|nr:hypothetical protein [Dictyobacter vulcani]
MRDQTANSFHPTAERQGVMTAENKLSRVNRGSVYALRFALLVTLLVFVIVAGNLLIQSINAFQSGGKVGKTLFTLDGQSSNQVTALAWSPVGDRVASVGSNAQIWDAMTGQHTIKLNNNGSAITAVAWSADAKQLVTGGPEITVWDAQSGKQLLTYITQGQKAYAQGSLSVKAIEWSPDKTKIATAYTYLNEGKNASTHVFQRVDVWNAATGKTITSYDGHKSTILSLAWSSDSKRLASASTDGLAVWNAANGQNVVKYATTGKVTSVSWSPDDRDLVSASNALEIWDVKNAKKPVGILDAHANATTPTYVKWSPDGTFIASADSSVAYLECQQRQ